MATEYRHGIETLEVDDDITSIETGESNVIGVIGTAPDADEDTFPLNTPVLIAGNPREALKLGASGTLPDAVDGIFDHFGADVIVVRVTELTDINQMMSQIVGNIAALTGVHAFKKALTLLKLIPKLLIAPGFTAYRPADGIAGVNVGNGGHNYSANTKASVAGGYGVELVVTVTDGIIQAITPTKHGWGFSVPPDVVISDAGTPAKAVLTFTDAPTASETVTIGTKTYKFVTALAALYDVLIGSDVASSIANLSTAVNATLAGAGSSYYAGISANTNAVASQTATNELTVTAITAGLAGNNIAVATTSTKGTWGAGITKLSGGVVGSGAAATAVLAHVANPVVAELLGIASDMRSIVIADSQSTSYADAIAYRTDFDTDRLWIVEGGSQVWSSAIDAAVSQPVAARLAGKQAYMDQNYGFWYSASNQALNGIIGVDRIIDWSYTSSTVEGQLLNSNAIAVCVQQNGYRVLGTRSPTSKSKWKFLPVRRTADAVYDAIEKAMQEAPDRPINVGLLDWIEGSVNKYLRYLKASGAILDGKAWLDKSLNPVSQLADGQLVVDFDIEPPAPLERLTFRAHRNAGYYEEVLDTFLTQAS
jgi:phage tail sheath protein FI